MTTRTIRTVIVDGEPLAREGLRVRLTREPDIEIVGEANDGISAVEAIEGLTPDLVFLDVQMPGLPAQRGYRAGDPKTCGFDVLDRVSGTHLPVVIFVTACASAFSVSSRRTSRSRLGWINRSTASATQRVTKSAKRCSAVARRFAISDSTCG